MSYITLADLGRGGRGGRGGWRGGRGWRGGGYPYWGGGGWYPWDTLPIAVVDQVGPDFAANQKAAEVAEKDKIQAITAAVRAELAKKPGAMGQMYIDPMGPGARDADIDRVARDDEIVDEAIPAREALMIRRAAGLGETLGPAVSDIDAKHRGNKFWTGAYVLFGAATGYIVGSMIWNKVTRTRATT